MQTLDSAVAAAQIADRHAVARTAPRRPPRPQGQGHRLRERLVLRRSSAEDAPALARLARLDSAARPRGEMLVAEVDERLVAAVPVDGGRAIADPFRPPPTSSSCCAPAPSCSTPAPAAHRGRACASRASASPKRCRRPDAGRT